MTVHSQAVLAIWVDIDPADDCAFEHWHSREHVQERVACPGWLRGSRFKGVEKPGRYLLFYDAETAQAFESDTYYTRLRNPSAMSRAIFPKFRDTWRTVCTVEQRWGDGIGAAALTLRMKAGNTAPFDKLAALETVRVDLLAGQANVGQAHTTEKDLRPRRTARSNGRWSPSSGRSRPPKRRGRGSAARRGLRPSPHRVEG